MPPKTAYVSTGVPILSKHTLSVASEGGMHCETVLGSIYGSFKRVMFILKYCIGLSARQPSPVIGL